MSDTDNYGSDNSNYGTPDESTYGTSNYGTPDNSEYGTNNYGTPDESTYGTSNYGTPDNSEYGTNNYGTPDNSEYGTSNYGTPDESTYGTGNYGTPDESTYGTSNYGTPDESTYGTSNYGTPDNSEYGNNNYGTPDNSEYGTSNYGTPDNSEYGTSNYGTPDNSEYGTSNYGTPDNSEYGTSNYGTPDNSEYGNNSYGTPDNSEYGNSNYGTPDNSEYGNSNYGTPENSEYGNNNYGTPDNSQGYGEQGTAGSFNNSPNIPNNYSMSNNSSYNNAGNSADDNGDPYFDDPYNSVYVSKAAPPMPKKKSGGKLKFVIPAILVVVAVLSVAAFANAAKIKTFFAKTFMSATDYYKSVETDELEKTAAMYGNQYDDMLFVFGDLNNKSCRIDANLQAEDAAYTYLNLLGSYLGVKFNWFKNAGVSTVLSSNNGQFGLTQQYSLNGTEIANLISAYTADKDTVYAGCPELSDKYIAYKCNSGVNFKEIIDVIDKLTSELPDKSVIERIILRYGNKIIDSFDNVEKSDATLTAGSISQSCTEYKITISGDNLKSMILDILTELSADEDVKLLLTKNYDAIRAILNDADIPSLKDISSKLPDATGEQIYDLLVAALNQFKANINESAVFDNIGITPAMSVYIDGSGQIIGRIIEIGSMAVSFKMPQSGKDFALEISLNGLKSMKIPQGCGITGTGTIDDGKLSGDFVAVIPGKVDGVSFRISDLDLDRLWQGYFDGKIRYDLAAMLKNSPAANFGGLSVEYGLSGGRDHTNAEFSLYMNDSKMVTLGLDCMIGQAAENIAVPSDGDTIAVDNISNIAGWLATVKFDRVFEALKNAGMDESILEYISKQFTKGLLPQ